MASLRCVTLVTPLVLAVFGGHCRLAEDRIRDENIFTSDSSDDDFLDDDDDDWEGRQQHTVFFAVLLIQSLSQCEDVSTDESSLDEQNIEELAEGLEDIALAEEFCRALLPDERNVSCRKSRKNGRQMSCLYLDDWIHFRMEKRTAQLVLALRQKWQVKKSSV